MNISNPLLERVKTRLGIFYSEFWKNEEVKGMIRGAVNFMKSAGWDINLDLPSPSAIDAIVIWCKMSQSTDPEAMQNNAVLINLILQNRGETDQED